MDIIIIMFFHIIKPLVNQIKIFFTDKNIFPPVYRIRYKINSFRCKIPDSCSHKIHLLIYPRKLIFTICNFNRLSYPSESRKSAGDSDGGFQDDGTMKQFRWTTPVSNYKEFEGRKIPTAGKTIWHYPEGDFTYGVFELKSIEYNVVKEHLK